VKVGASGRNIRSYGYYIAMKEKETEDKRGRASGCTYQDRDFLTSLLRLKALRHNKVARFDSRVSVHKYAQRCLDIYTCEEAETSNQASNARLYQFASSIGKADVLNDFIVCTQLKLLAQSLGLITCMRDWRCGSCLRSSSLCSRRS
jgi:hypothetical protein